MEHIEIHHSPGILSATDQQIVSSGFAEHSHGQNAPQFKKEQIHWTARSSDKRLVGVATADLLWDWLYLDELWVAESLRGTGLGRRLIEAVERYAHEHNLVGVWLWTQNWQADRFYSALGYSEFARFPDFPRGYERIGFRKILRR